MRNFLTLITLLISTVSFPQTYNYERAGIEISFDTSFYTPFSWKITKSKVIDNQSHYLNIVKNALNKYPEGIIKNIKKVYILNTLATNGVSLGGTKYNGCIFIKVRGITDVNIEKTLHHEFCHLLYFKYEELFPKTEWINNTKLEYSGSFKASHNGCDKKIHDAKLFQYGFLYEYATISIDEDMASLAETFFFSSDRVDIKNNILLKNKYLLLVSFYKKIDPKVSIQL
jgi:hypothetical protein